MDISNPEIIFLRIYTHQGVLKRAPAERVLSRMARKYLMKLLAPVKRVLRRVKFIRVTNNGTLSGFFFKIPLANKTVVSTTKI